MRPLSEQVVVVTGASSGIGRTTAQLLGPRGASVALLARNEEALHVAAEVREAGGTAEVVVADVSDWSQVNRAREQVLGRFGRIDGWVNNAGVAVYADTGDQHSAANISTSARSTNLG